MGNKLTPQEEWYEALFRTGVAPIRFKEAFRDIHARLLVLEGKSDYAEELKAASVEADKRLAAYKPGPSDPSAYIPRKRTYSTSVPDALLYPGIAVFLISLTLNVLLMIERSTG